MTSMQSYADMEVPKCFLTIIIDLHNLLAQVIILAVAMIDRTVLILIHMHTPYKFQINSVLSWRTTALLVLLAPSFLFLVLLIILLMVFQWVMLPRTMPAESKKPPPLLLRGSRRPFQLLYRYQDLYQFLYLHLYQDQFLYLFLYQDQHLFLCQDQHLFQCQYLIFCGAALSRLNVPIPT